MLVPSDYHATLAQLKDRISVAQYRSLTAVNQELILMYLDLGSVISDRVKGGWGLSVVDSLSKDLQAEYPGVKGLSPRNLRRMKLIFEETFGDEFWTQLVSKIPWGHTNLIFQKIKNPDQRIFLFTDVYRKRVEPKCIGGGDKVRLLQQKNTVPKQFFSCIEPS